MLFKLFIKVYFFSFVTNYWQEGDMKDVIMLLGFSMGLVTGALLYKYSTSAKQMVDKSEKAVMKEVDKAAKKVKSAQKKA